MRGRVADILTRVDNLFLGQQFINLLHGARVGNLRSYYTGYFWHNIVVVS